MRCLIPQVELVCNFMSKSKEDASGPTWEFGSSQAPTQMFVSQGEAAAALQGAVTFPRT